ncbi:unnamed protein product [Microthlaspi erraticum]|uniref:Uncharacterized protein n=1 Tax=Microthlaspi erraticum TaxID=1685480 RepID=A0A6D2LF98_9BRAS|nr:unnamed protein product [Microthlaspi erraticum]
MQPLRQDQERKRKIHQLRPSVKPSQLTMTLFPTKFENGKIEYKIRYKGRSRPFSRAKALVTSEQSRDPTKLKELLSQVLTITLDGLLEHSGAYGTGAWLHGRSSTGYAKEEGGSHLEDQLDHLLDQPVEFLNSTGQASTRSS